MTEAATILDEPDVDVRHGDAREVLKSLPDASVDACVTDPPYALTQGKRGGTGVASINLDSPYGRSRIGTGNGPGGFMGQKWDTGETAFDPDFWREVYRVLKPGAHVVAFGGTRTYHRLVCAIEDAGFEIRDQVAWLFGTGFPKSLDVSKAIDKAFGQEGARVPTAAPVKRMIPGADQNKRGWVKTDEREFVPHEYVPASETAQGWQGWGTALKPGHEPIVLARKPLDGTVAQNVLQHGTGAMNIDACRVPADEGRPLRILDAKQTKNNVYEGRMDGSLAGGSVAAGETTLGRWPANVVHDGSDEVVGAFPDAPGQQGPVSTASGLKTNRVYGPMKRENEASANRRYTDRGVTNFAPLPGMRRAPEGSAARFFYCAKAGEKDRVGSSHPTVKPVALMRWLVRLVTPPGGVVLDPFAGTGTTGQAAVEEGFDAILIEREQQFVSDIYRRLFFT